jgi:putative polyhydroxyalkanoate system protein
LADLHIQRDHQLGLVAARAIGQRWAEQARGEFGMECTSEEGESEDRLSFSRSGVSGTLVLNAESFDLQAKLGFLLGAFKERIEAEIVKNLDALLAQQTTSDPIGTEQGIQSSDAKS